MEKLLNSIYIHIPFCKSKCNYCNFVSFTDKNSYIKEYFEALNREISDNFCYFSDNFYYFSDSFCYFSTKKFDTIYIGGGTPSLVEEIYYENLLENINLSDTAEVTIEVNPGTISAGYLGELREIGFNRLSIGVQSLDDRVLKSLNRPHSSEEAIRTVNEAKQGGFNNVSIDLIYGLPGQTVLDWQNTLYQALNLDINHISTYGLKIEENTEFFRNPPKDLPDEEQNARMYLDTIKILEENGFMQYEISNFAKPGAESRHNMAYWNNQEYFGFGVAAHGYVNGVRYGNQVNLQDYLKNPLEKFSWQKLCRKEILEEAIFLGLRKKKGVNFPKMQRRYGVNFYENYKNIIEKYVKQGFMNYDGENLWLTSQGMLISNFILADFLL